MAKHQRARHFMQDPQDFCTPKQARAAIDLAYARGRTDYALLIRVLCETARRSCEVVGQRKYEIKNKKRKIPLIKGLTPGDLDILHGLIYFNIAKKRKVEKRPFPVSRELLTDLWKYARDNRIGTKNLFFPVCNRTVERMIKKYLREIRIREDACHPHALRHGWAIAAARKADDPADIVLIQEQLAHESLEVTRMYLRYSVKKLRDLQKKVMEED